MIIVPQEKETGDQFLSRVRVASSVVYGGDDREQRAFCATGKGGGVDNSCGAGAGGPTILMAPDRDSGGGSSTSSRWGGETQPWGRSSETEIWTPGKPLFPGAENIASIKIHRPNDVKGQIEDGLKMTIADAVLASGPVIAGADRTGITRPRLEIITSGHGVEMAWTAMGIATGEGFQGEDAKFADPAGKAVRAVEASRNIWKTNFGAVLYMGGFYLHPDFQGKGIALESVVNSASSPVVRMEMSAERYDASNPKMRMTGYKVWPKYGYDCPVSRVRQELSMYGKDIPEQFRSAETLTDIFAMKGGPEWWAAEGTAISLIFDRRPRSRSMEVLLKLQDRVKGKRR